MAPTGELRSSFGTGLTIAGALLAAGVLALLFYDASWVGILEFGPLPLLFAATVWAMFQWPCVRVSDGGVEIRNVLRTLQIPWPAVIDIDARWGLRLITRLGNYSAWSVSPPSRTGRGGRRQPAAAAQAVTERWQALKAAGYLANPRLEIDRVVWRWNWPVLIVLGALLVLSIAGLIGYRPQ